MNKRVLIALGIVVGVFTILLFGSALGAGLIHFLTQSPEPAFAFQSDDADPNSGLIVVAVDEGSTSEEEGIVRGDILLEIDGQPVNTLTEVVGELGNFHEGDEVQLTILHGDELREFVVEMETDYYPGALGIRLCCGADEGFGFTSFIDAELKPMILEVVPNSPADDAGLQIGDVILSINGEETDPDQSLAEVIAEFEVGDEILLEIRCRGTRESKQVEVTLGEHPEEDGQPYLGVRLAPNIRSRIIQGDGLIPLPDEDGFGFRFRLPPFEFPFLDRDRFDFHFLPFNKEFLPFNFDGKGIQGVLITDVVEDSPAAEGGIMSGDLILAVDDEVIASPETFRDEIADRSPGDSVALTVLRQKEKFEIEVQLGEHPEEPNNGYLGVSIGVYIHFEGGDFDGFPHNFHHHFDFDGFPWWPHPEEPKPETENQST